MYYHHYSFVLQSVIFARSWLHQQSLVINNKDQ